MTNFFRNRKRLALALGVLALLAMTMGAYYYLRPDPHVAKVQELRQQLMGEGGRNLPPEQRRQLWGQLRAEYDKLPEGERRKMEQEGQRRFMEPIKKYFQLQTPEEKTAYLDQQIQQWEER